MSFELDCEPLSWWLTISILLEPSAIADICQCKYFVPDTMETFFFLMFCCKMFGFFNFRSLCSKHSKHDGCSCKV